MFVSLACFIDKWWVSFWKGTQEEAAEAYDIAAIKFRGLNAVTNFDMSRYDVKSIMNSNLPIGGITAKNKPSESSSDTNRSIESKYMEDSFTSQSSSLTFSLPIKPDPQDYWSLLALQQNQSSQNNAKCDNPMFQPSPNTSAFHTPSSYNMDFSAASAINQGYLNGGMIQQQHQNPSSIPFANPIPVTSSYDTATSYGSWGATSIHAYQTAKPNLAVLQTPIFGMEWSSERLKRENLRWEGYGGAHVWYKLVQLGKLTPTDDRDWATDLLQFLQDWLTNSGTKLSSSCFFAFTDIWFYVSIMEKGILSVSCMLSMWMKEKNTLYQILYACFLCESLLPWSIAHVCIGLFYVTFWQFLL